MKTGDNLTVFQIEDGTVLLYDDDGTKIELRIPARAEPRIEMRTATHIVSGEQRARDAAGRLFDLSAWFILTPLPDDQWEITVKEENKNGQWLGVSREPWIWLQETEQAGTADCGCVLHRDCYWGVDDSDGGGPAVTFCPLHNHAGELLDSLTELSDWMRDHLGPRDGIHEMLVRAVERIAKAKGGVA